MPCLAAITQNTPLTILLNLQTGKLGSKIKILKESLLPYFGNKTKFSVYKNMFI